MTLATWTPKSGLKCRHPYYAYPTRESAPQRRESSWNPATDIYDTEESYVLKMEVPGFAKDDIQIEVKDGKLTVTGERKEVETEEVVFHRSERPTGTFSRSFRLPRNVDGSMIDAQLKQGVLRLTIAKPEDVKPRNIPIQFN